MAMLHEKHNYPQQKLDLDTLAEQYAARFVRDYQDAEDAEDYAAQAALDTGDPRFKAKVRKAIKNMSIQEAVEFNARILAGRN
jgi:predicted Zn-dependent peptidase